jgi:hypothetical protein
MQKCKLESNMARPTATSDRKSVPLRFAFTVPLVKLTGAGTVYALEIPQPVTLAIGRRGPVPIVATLNRTVEIQASLVPMGGGRHRLQLIARTRGELEIEPGDNVRVALLVPEKPPKVPLPPGLLRALTEVDLQDTFAELPVGKQNHIILWIEQAARPQTREKRVAMAIEVAFRARERAYERKNTSKSARLTSRREES